MRNPVSKSLALACAIALLQSFGCSRSEVAFEDPWIPAAPPNVEAFAGYLVISNDTDEAISIDAGESERFREVSFHRTIHDGEIARMVPVPVLSVPAGDALSLQPGGHHLMLVGPNQPLRPGDVVPIVLTLSDGRRLAVEFTVRTVDLTR